MQAEQGASNQASRKHIRSFGLIALSVAMTVAWIAPAAQAAAVLTIRPITWNVVGLDSNNVNAGPDKFASGARVCNTGSSAATNVVTNYVWLSANSYISLQAGSPSSISISSLAAGSCSDFYYNLQVTRDAAAYDTARRYEITATADGLGTINTPTPREIYVEHLISQNRNSVTAITGPGGVGDPAATTVYVGQTYTYKLYSSTATQGYEQLSTFLNFPNVIFQILSVNATYTAPSGGTNDTIYADACGWENNPGSANYLSCVGPNNYSGGKAGGDVVTTYVVKILAAGTSTISGLVYDHSGSSYHYNSDLGTGVNAVTITALPTTDLSITKADSPDPVTAGQNVTYTMVATNNGPNDATGVTVSDPIPAGTSFVSADSGGSLSAGTVTWTIGALASGASATVHLVVEVDPSRSANISNTSTVSGDEHDPDNTDNSATASTSVVQSADLAITKSDSPDPVTAGQNITYTIGVANNGPSDATSVTVSDPIPSGTSFVSADAGGSLASGTVTWAIGGLAASASTTVHLVVQVDPNQTADVPNTASVTADQSDPDNSNNSSSATTSVSVPPPPPSTDLSITKSGSPDPVTAGQDITYTIGVTNNGPDDATGVSVSDDVPAGTSFVSADSGGSLSSGTVSWALGSLASGASTTVHLVVQVDPSRSADVSNTASVVGNEADPDGSNNSATATTSVIQSADLSISKSDSPDPVTAGQNITYTIDVTNNGPSDATGVTVSDDLPAGTSFVSADSGGSLSSSTVTWSLGGLAASASATVHLVVQVDPKQSADVSNTATVTGDQSDPDNSNNSATATTSVTPPPPPLSTDLSITKQDSPDPVTAGQDITYTLDVTNNGPDDATGVIVSDDVPTGTSFVSADSGGSLSSGTVTWSIGSLTSGSSTTVHVVVQVDPGQTADVSNTASVTGDQPDPDNTNNSATATTSVTPASTSSTDLQITKSGSPDPVTAGQNITYTIDVTNNGPDDATGVTVSDDVPTGTSFVSADSVGSLSSGTVTWSIGSLTSGSSTTVHVVVQVDPGQTADVSNTASVTGDQPDPDNTNNSATATTSVTPASTSSTDLQITKSGSPDPANGGDNITYTIGVTNNGPDDATGVTVTDPVPSATSFVSADSGGSLSSGTVTWTVGSLASGASTSLHLVVQVDPGQTADVSNTTTVTGDQSDPDLSNNSATAITTIAAPAARADLGITKQGTPSPVVAGKNISYTIVVTNNGPDDATGVTVSDAIPSGTAVVSVDAGGSLSGGTVTWSIGALTSGTSMTLHVVLRVDPAKASDVSNTATVTGNEQDPDSTNNSATAVTRVVGETNLVLTKTVNHDAPEQEGVVIYDILVQNHGPSRATGVVVQDSLPSGLVYESDQASQGSYDHQTGLWHVGELRADGHATLRLATKVTGIVGSSIVNHAEIKRSDQRDPHRSDDSSAASVVVAPRSGGQSTGGPGGTGVLGETALTGADVEGLSIALVLLLVTAGFFLRLGRRRPAPFEDW